MKYFGEYLVDQHVISESNLVEALIYQSNLLPSLPEIVRKKKMISDFDLLQIFRTQSEKKMGFIEAAEDLGLWVPGMMQQIEEELISLRMPLGQVIVEKGFAKIEAITHALDEFLGSAAPLFVSTPAVVEKTTLLSATELKTDAYSSVHPAFQEIWNQQFYDLLFIHGNIQNKVFEISEEDINQLRIEFQKYRGVSRFHQMKSMETLIQQLDILLGLVEQPIIDLKDLEKGENLGRYQLSPLWETGAQIFVELKAFDETSVTATLRQRLISLVNEINLKTKPGVAV